MRPIDGDALQEEVANLTMTITGIRAGKGVLSEVMNEYRKTILRTIDEQPTIEQYGTWIPCSERLPEMSGMPCLLTAVNGFGQIRVIKGFANYMEGGKFRFLTNEKDIDIDCWNVIAWMPLPKPYREEKDDRD